MTATDRELAEVEAWLTAVGNDLDMTAGDRGRWTAVRMADPGWCRVRRGQREWTWSIDGPDDAAGFEIVRADMAGEMREAVRRRLPQDRPSTEVAASLGVDAVYAAIAAHHGFDPTTIHIQGWPPRDMDKARMTDPCGRLLVTTEGVTLHQGVVAGTLHAYARDGQLRLRYERVAGVPMVRIARAVVPETMMQALPGLALSQVVDMEELQGLKDVRIIHAEPSATAIGEPALQLRLMPIVRWPHPPTYPVEVAMRRMGSTRPFR